MFRFTLLWTLIDVIGIHLIAAMYAMMIQWRNWKLIWITPVVFALVGGVEALIAGSVVGGVYVETRRGPFSLKCSMLIRP